MKGSIRQRGENSWELRVFVGRDPVSGRVQYATKTVRGGKREAQRALAAAGPWLPRRDRGIYKVARGPNPSRRWVLDADLAGGDRCRRMVWVGKCLHPLHRPPRFSRSAIDPGRAIQGPIARTRRCGRSNLLALRIRLDAAGAPGIGWAPAPYSRARLRHTAIQEVRVITMSVRVEEGIRDELDELARTQGLSVSEIVRQAIEARLGRDVARELPAPRSISKSNRHLLALLHEILGRLDPDAADYHSGRIEVFNRGFTGEYEDVFVAVQDELSISDCRLVWDILDMFSVIQSSVAKIEIRKSHVLDPGAEMALTFHGLDLSDEREGPMLAYARHLIANHRWTALADRFGEATDRGDSHMPMLDVYKRMLEVYRPIWQRLVAGNGRGADRYVLNEQELAELLRARHSPR